MLQLLLKHGHSLAIVSLCLFLNACSLLTQMSQEPIERVESLLEQEEYQRALNLIDQLKPEDPEYDSLQKQRPEIKKQASEFEQKMLQEARNYQSLGEWGKALYSFEHGLQKLPDSQPLNEALKTFYEARNTYIEDLEFQLLISKGQCLPNHTPILEQLANADPKNSQYRRAAEQNLKEVSQVTEDLTQCGQTALASREYHLARKCLQLAYTLSPTEEIQESLNQAEQALAQIAQKKEQKAQIIKAKNTEKIISAFEESFEQSDYAAAKVYLQTLAKEDPNHPQLNQLKQSLDAAITQKVKELTEQGQQFYSLGEYEKAFDTWRKGLNLEPNNSTLLIHIERVQRVLDSLKRLNTQEQSEPFPEE